MLLLDLANCGPSGLLRVLYFFKLILDILFIIIPVGLIIFLLIDFSKAMISGDESAQKKTFNLAMKRILYAVIVFLVPSIVNFVNAVLGDLGVDYSVCLNNLTIEEINYLDSVEFSCDEAEKYVTFAERKLSDDSFETAQEYIDAVMDAEIKVQLQDRLNIAKEYAKEHVSNTSVNLNYDGMASSGSCSPGSGITVLSSEPDPSCAINYWSNYINEENFIYPKNGNKILGAWPKDYANIPTKLSNVKTYYDGKLIWPVTPSDGKYRFVYEHNGIDIMAPIGTPIYAPASGILLYSEWGHTVNKGSDETAYSVTIILDDPIVYNGVSYDTIFLTHMSGIVNRCANSACNKNVSKGDLLGFVGNAAGDASSGGYAPHLHMTIYPMESTYKKGLKTSSIQSLYNLNCGSGCQNISIKAGE